MTEGEREVGKGPAIVTGAASGMGEASAIAMVNAGWPVLMCDLNAERLDDAAARLKAAIPRAGIATLAGDLSDPSFYDRLDETLSGRQIGAVVHAAGISSTMADAPRVMDVNLAATIRLVDFARSRMAPGGAVVLFASTSAYLLGDKFDSRISAVTRPEDVSDILDLVPDSVVAYSVSKRGVYLLAQNQALDFGRHQARIVSISPGLIDTPMGRQEQQTHTMMQEIVDFSPAGRKADPSEVAAAAVFLCSPQASFITGCDLLVDGGAVAVDRLRPSKQGK